MQFPESYKFTCVSTAHLRESDVKYMETEFDGLVALYAEGFFLWTGYASPEAPDGILAGVSPEMRAVVKAAEDAGFNYIQFDADGPVMDEFPTFDW